MLALSEPRADTRTLRRGVSRYQGLSSISVLDFELLLGFDRSGLQLGIFELSEDAPKPALMPCGYALLGGKKSASLNLLLEPISGSLISNTYHGCLAT